MKPLRLKATKNVCGPFEFHRKQTILVVSFLFTKKKTSQKATSPAFALVFLQILAHDLLSDTDGSCLVQIAQSLPALPGITVPGTAIISMGK